MKQKKIQSHILKKIKYAEIYLRRSPTVQKYTRLMGGFEMQIFLGPI